ncbi:MAG: cyclodeaminase/cyclohydrolase family protein [Desulfobacterales bacterium]
MLADLSLSELLEKTASNEPVPGGGSLSAMAAAAAAALAEMVAGLTIGREKFAAAAPEMEELAAKARNLRESLLLAIDRDSGAYASVMAAFRLPRSSDDEKRLRAEAVQAATREAALVPLTVAERALEVMTLAGTAVRKGNPNAVTDGAVATLLARAAVLGALFNVKINLGGIQDEEFVDKISSRVRELESRVGKLEADILSEVNL